MKKNELDPKHPERICWGCDKYCAAHDLACGNGTIRTPHPSELFGKDWLEWAQEHDAKQRSGSAAPDAAGTPVAIVARRSDTDDVDQLDRTAR